MVTQQQNWRETIDEFDEILRPENLGNLEEEVYSVIVREIGKLSDEEREKIRKRVCNVLETTGGEISYRKQVKTWLECTMNEFAERSRDNKRYCEWPKRLMGEIKGVLNERDV